MTENSNQFLKYIVSSLLADGLEDTTSKIRDHSSKSYRNSTFWREILFEKNKRSDLFQVKSRKIFEISLRPEQLFNSN